MKLTLSFSVYIFFSIKASNDGKFDEQVYFMKKSPTVFFVLQSWLSIFFLEN